jgi:hypothetical protein
LALRLSEGLGSTAGQARGRAHGSERHCSLRRTAEASRWRLRLHCGDSGALMRALTNWLPSWSIRLVRQPDNGVVACIAIESVIGLGKRARTSCVGWRVTEPGRSRWKLNNAVCKCAEARGPTSVLPNVRAKLPTEVCSVSPVRNDAPCAAHWAYRARRSGSA